MKVLENQYFWPNNSLKVFIFLTYRYRYHKYTSKVKQMNVKLQKNALKPFSITFKARLVQKTLNNKNACFRKYFNYLMCHTTSFAVTKC